MTLRVYDKIVTCLWFIFYFVDKDYPTCKILLLVLKQFGVNHVYFHQRCYDICMCFVSIISSSMCSISSEIEKNGGHVWMPSGNRPSHEPIANQIYVAISYGVTSHNELNLSNRALDTELFFKSFILDGLASHLHILCPLTHICVSKLTIIGSDDGQSPDRRQVITRTNDGIMLIRPWEQTSMKS